MTESAYASGDSTLVPSSGGTGALRFGLASGLRTGRSALRDSAEAIPAPAESGVTREPSARPSALIAS